MGFGRFRFGRSFGNVNGRMFRGARPLVQYLLNLYRGAAAAYSLRSLSRAWRKEPVVEVRRASDDTTKSFTATDIGDGTMANWVNATVALPLDTASGAAAAYSLRNLSTSYSGNVVNVRRSSDSATADFTAADVAGSAMVDWVNTDVDLNHGTFVNDGGSQPFETFSGSGSDGFTGTNTSNNGKAIAPLNTSLSVGDTVSVSFDLTLVSGTCQVVLGDSVGTAGFPVSNVEEYTTSGSKTAVLTVIEEVHASSTKIATRLVMQGIGSTTYEFTVSNLVITQTSASGHVTKWYDQSGNNNHAEQTTEASQPKVVDGGVLVMSNSSPSMLFEHGNADRCFVELDPFFSTGDDISAMVVTERLENGYYGSLIGYDNNNTSLSGGFMMFDESTSRQPRSIAGGASAISTVVPNNQPHIRSTFWDNSTFGLTTYVDGGNEQSHTGTTSVVAPPDKTRIGDYYQLGASGKYHISELIIYNSDQTGNRKAIESNMADYHGNIDLPAGFDSGNNEVDGFVATWYDQSGNGNDAVQNVATSQPKIVEGGVLVADGIKFDGADDVLSAPSLIDSTTGFSVFATALSDTDESVAGLWAEENSLTLGNDERVVGFLDTRTSPSRHSNYSPDSTARYVDLLSKLSANTEYLHTTLSDGSNMSGVLNGTLQGSVASSVANAGVAFNIGRQIAGPLHLSGSISEVIIYNSDQSAKRTGIEGNINDYYEIFADETYRRPDGSAIFRPDGTSVYERP